MSSEADRVDAPVPETSARLRPWRAVVLLLAMLGSLAATNALTQMSGRAKIEPGPTLDVSRAAKGAGVLDRDPNDGRFLLLTVQVRRVPVWESLLSSVSGNDQLVEVGTGSRGDRAAIAGSKNAAAVAASRFVPAAATDVRLTGLRVEATLVGSPADRGGLHSGDVITSINGRRVESAAQLRRAAASTSAVTIGVVRSEVRKKFTITPEAGQFGVVVTEVVEGTFPVSFDTGRIDGGSGGLAMALATVDALTLGDLTGGKTVAVSGMISTDGSVLPVSGLKEKALAARNEGAVVLLAPVGAAEEIGSTLPVVEVGDLDEAIAWLCLRGSDDQICSQP